MAVIKTGTIEVGIYGCWVKVAFVDNLNDAAKKYKLDLKEDLSGYGAVVPRLEVLNKKNEDYSFYYCFFLNGLGLHIIAHEALHLTNAILHHRGVPMDYDNDEAHAYLLGYLVKKILKIKDKK